MGIKHSYVLGHLFQIILHIGILGQLLHFEVRRTYKAYLYIWIWHMVVKCGD